VPPAPAGLRLLALLHCDKRVLPAVTGGCDLRTAAAVAQQHGLLAGFAGLAALSQRDRCHRAGC